MLITLLGSVGSKAKVFARYGTTPKVKRIWAAKSLKWNPATGQYISTGIMAGVGPEKPNNEGAMCFGIRYLKKNHKTRGRREGFSVLFEIYVLRCCRLAGMLSSAKHVTTLLCNIGDIYLRQKLTIWMLNSLVVQNMLGMRIPSDP